MPTHPLARPPTKSPMKPRAFEAALVRARALARATYIARDLTNAPPAHLTPRTLADAAKTLGLRFGFGVEIVDRAKLEEMGLIVLDHEELKETEIGKILFMNDEDAMGRHIRTMLRGVGG